MKVVKILLLLILVGVVAVLGLAMTKPNTFHVERSATIAAPPASVFANVDDLHRWPSWSPWEKLDPNMKRTYEGPESGVGAAYAWVGNEKVGEGKMTITESIPDSRVGMRLDFLKPMQNTCDVALNMAPEGDGTRVTWTMDGKNNFTAKIFGVFMNVDQMVGKDFETGLAQLKTVAESTPAPPPADSTAVPTPDTTKTQ